MPTMTASIGVRLRPEIAAKIKAIAAREGNTESAILRRIVAEGLRVIEHERRGEGPQCLG